MIHFPLILLSIPPPTRSYYKQLNNSNYIDIAVDNWFDLFQKNQEQSFALLSSLLCRSNGLFVDFGTQSPSPYEYIQLMNTVVPSLYPPLENPLPLIFSQRFFFIIFSNAFFQSFIVGLYIPNITSVF